MTNLLQKPVTKYTDNRELNPLHKVQKYQLFTRYFLTLVYCIHANPKTLKSGRHFYESTFT